MGQDVHRKTPRKGDNRGKIEGKQPLKGKEEEKWGEELLGVAPEVSLGQQEGCDCTGKREAALRVTEMESLGGRREKEDGGRHEPA